METITSRDGTQIACWKSGAGPPLLLLHGAMSDHNRWREVGGPLEQQFTLYTIDRRGRGLSGDAPDYSMQRECEDVLAVLEFIGEPAFVFGHSYGAGVALEASLQTNAVRRLALYEPAILEGVQGYYDTPRLTKALDEIEGLLREDRSEAAMIVFLRDVVEITDGDVDMLKATPSWPNRVAAAHTVLREVRSEGDFKFDPANYTELTAPTLLLTGSESFQIARDGTAALHEALPSSRVVVLEGQGHVAMTTAPELFIRELSTFLLE